MPLAPHDRIGPYEVTGTLGFGGMGEVYRARDTRLQRDVALKVLPAALERDPERLARFAREAQILASMNQPNIAMLYGLEESGGTRALVMELVEGPTLADRIKQGPIPIDEAIQIARQIAEAFEYAHERGVVHRDLKPANVKITLEGRVKVLDFGLAKALAIEQERSGDPQSSPTLTMGMTGAGMIMGTAAYMSPEQAKGKSADRRADIWSFGVVLAEMLSGKPIYSGETAGEIMASIIKDDPPVGSLPPSTSPAIRYLIERCLNKDPQQRLQHMGEARILLQNPDARNLIGSAAPAAPAPSRSSRLSWILAGALALALAALAWIHFRETQPVERSVRFQIEAPGKSAIGAFRLSPDGRYLAYIAGSKVWVRALDSLESKVLDQTDGATYPFWSPDGQNIGFFASGKLKRIPRIGGVVQTLCDASAGRGGTWNRDGVIVFSVGPNAPLFRVSAAGGTPVAVTKLQGASAQLEGHRFPEFLPDGRHFLYLGQSANPETSGIFAGSLDGSVVRVSPIFSSALFAPGSSASATGFLLFRKSDTLMAQVFDPVRLQAAGDAFPVAERTGIAANTNTGFGAFAAAGDGTLAISAGGAGNQQLVWTDRRGKALAVVNDGVSLDTAGERDSFSLSPDDRKIVFTSGNNEDATLWLQNLGGGTPARFTFAAGRNGNAIWSPDGSRIVYGLQSFSGYSSELIVKPSNGSGKEEVLLGTGLNRSPYDWSRDGKWIAFRNDSPSADLWLLPLEGDRKPVSFLETPAAEINAHFSPDGKFLVYQSDESGRPEVYVQPVPPNGSKWQVSKAGGESPHWKGSEIFFAAPDQKLMAAQVKTAPTFDSGTPQSLFEISGAYDVASDGQHFLIAEPATGDAARLPPVTIITHWH